VFVQCYNRGERRGRFTGTQRATRNLRSLGHMGMVGRHAGIAGVRQRLACWSAGHSLQLYDLIRDHSFGWITRRSSTTNFANQDAGFYLPGTRYLYKPIKAVISRCHFKITHPAGRQRLQVTVTPATALLPCPPRHRQLLTRQLASASARSKRHLAIGA
jgi:hypothetical protein